MPSAAAGAVVGWLVGIGITGTVATVIGTAVYVGTALAINAGLNKLGEALAGKPKIEQGGPDSREFTVKGTIEPRQLIYGEVRSGGAIAFVGTSGTDNQLLNFVVVYAGHESEDITDVWLDSRHIEDADIASDGEVTLSEYQDNGPRLYVLRYKGSSGQVADPELNLRYTEWTSNHVGFGLTYVHFRLDKSDKVWSGTAPSSFFALVKGRKLYDPRKDDTNGGTGAHRVDIPSTWEWSDNWALCVRDYISGGSVQYNSSAPDKRLTVGEDDSRIDDTYTIAAANISDEDVLIPPASPETTQKRYNCNVQLSCGTIHRENLETLLAAGAGKLSYVEGKYRIYAGAYNAPTVSLTANDVVDGIEVITHPSEDENYNQVNGEFMDPDRNWTMNSFPTQNNTTYQSDDNGVNNRYISLHAVTNNYRAQRIARWHLNQSRNKIVVKFKQLSPKALLVGEWETFDVTIPEYGWSEQVFRALEIEDLPNGLVSIVARIESESLHADPDVADYTDPTTNIPPIYSVDEASTPSGLTAIPSRDGILFTWTQVGESRAKYAIYEHSSSTPFSSAVKIWEGTGNVAFIPKLDLTTRYYWITAIIWNRESTNHPSGAGVEGKASTLTQWITRGNAIAGHRTAAYTGANDGGSWDGLHGCYSVDAYGQCHIIAKPGAVNPAHIFVALDSDPVGAGATDYTALDYGFHTGNAGTVQIYELGVLIGTFGNYDASTELAIAYDGTDVFYIIDRVLVRTVNDPGRTFFGLIAFNRNTVGSKVHSLKFGPTAVLDHVDTADIREGAATTIQQTFDVGPDAIAHSGGASTGFTYLSMNYVPPVDQTVINRIMFSVRGFTTVAGNFSCFCALSLLTNGGSEIQPASVSITPPGGSGSGFDERTVSMQETYDLVAGNTYTFRIQASVNRGAGSGTFTATFSMGINILEVIKR